MSFENIAQIDILSRKLRQMKERIANLEAHFASSPFRNKSEYQALANQAIATPNIYDGNMEQPAFYDVGGIAGGDDPVVLNPNSGVQVAERQIVIPALDDDGHTVLLSGQTQDFDSKTSTGVLTVSNAATGGVKYVEGANDATVTKTAGSDELNFSGDFTATVGSLSATSLYIGGQLMEESNGQLVIKHTNPRLVIWDTDTVGDSGFIHFYDSLENVYGALGVDGNDMYVNANVTNLELQTGAVTRITVSENYVDFWSGDAGATWEPILYLHRDSSSPADADQLGQINFTFSNDAGTPEEVSAASIGAIALDITDGTEDGALVFYTTGGGSTAERMRLDNDGNLDLNNNSLIDAPHIISTGHVVIGIDSDNDSTTRKFLVETNSATAGSGTALLSVSETSTIFYHQVSVDYAGAKIEIDNPTTDDPATLRLRNDSLNANATAGEVLFGRSTATEFASIEGHIGADVTEGYLIFKTLDTSLAEQMRLTKDGKLQIDIITAQSDTDHQIQLDPVANKMYLIPGDDGTADNYIVLESVDATSAYPRVLPNADQEGFVGTSSSEWDYVYAVNVVRNGTSLDAYDDLYIIDNMDILRNSNGDPVLNPQGNPYIDIQTLPDFLRGDKIDHTYNKTQDPESKEWSDNDPIEGKAHIELGAWTDLAIGGIKQLHQKVKDQEQIILQLVEEINKLKGVN